MHKRIVIKAERLNVYVAIAIGIIAFWLTLTSVVEFILTEQLFIINYFSSKYKTYLLLGTIMLFSVITTFLKGRFSTVAVNHKLLLLSSLFVIGISMVFHTIYSNNYAYLQKFPKIKSVSKQWSIQGDQISIYGKNFGSPDAQGQVRVGDLYYGNIYWTNEKVIVEQPVPEDYITDTMVLTNSHGNSVNVAAFEIKDPSEVL